MKNNFKSYIIIISICLFFGIISGSIYNTFNKVKKNDTELEKYNAINLNMYGNGIKCYINNINGDTLETMDELKIRDKMVELNINIENNSKNHDLNYKVVVLVDSKQVDFYNQNNKIVRIAEVNPNKDGKNTFSLKLKDIDSKPKEITISLTLDNNNNYYNYCFNISDEKNLNTNYEMKLIDYDRIKNGIYINSTCYMNKINTNDLLFSEGKENIDIPILFKCSGNNQMFKIYLFDEQYNKVLINNNDFLCVRCNDNLYEGSINIKNTKEALKKYTLVAVPEGKENYKEYFSKQLTVIGE